MPRPAQELRRARRVAGVWRPVGRPPTQRCLVAVPLRARRMTSQRRLLALPSRKPSRDRRARDLEATSSLRSVERGTACREANHKLTPIGGVNPSAKVHLFLLVLMLDSLFPTRCYRRDSIWRSRMRRHWLTELGVIGIAVEVTHRSNRRVFGLSNGAPLRDGVAPPHRTALGPDEATVGRR